MDIAVENWVRMPSFPQTPLMIPVPARQGTWKESENPITMTARIKVKFPMPCVIPTIMETSSPLFWKPCRYLRRLMYRRERPRVRVMDQVPKDLPWENPAVVAHSIVLIT